jgi:hypothetical protein
LPNPAGRTGFSTRERGAADRGEVLALRRRGSGTGSTSRPPTKCGTHSGSKPGGGDARRRGWRDTLTLCGRGREDKHGGHALPQHEEDRLDWEVRSFVYYHLVEHGLPRDRWRHPYVLVAANLTSISYPNLYSNPPQHYPTQTDTPRRGSSGNPHPQGILRHEPTAAYHIAVLE